MSTVRSKAELERAKRSGEEEIVVEGDLADKLKKSRKVILLSGASLAALTAALATATATAPMTAGMSYFVAAAPVAAISGVEIAAIVAAAALGLALVIALFKDYEEISYSKGHLVLRKKQKPT